MHTPLDPALMIKATPKQQQQTATNNNNNNTHTYIEARGRGANGNVWLQDPRQGGGCMSLLPLPTLSASAGVHVF